MCALGIAVVATIYCQKVTFHETYRNWYAMNLLFIVHRMHTVGRSDKMLGLFLQWCFNIHSVIGLCLFTRRPAILFEVCAAVALTATVTFFFDVIQVKELREAEKVPSPVYLKAAGLF